MNPKVKNFSNKIYLTLQSVVILVGSGVLIWNIIAGVHDINISTKGKECSWSVIGTENLNTLKINDSDVWTDIIEKYAKTLDHPSKKYELKEILEKKCSDYLGVSIYDSSDRMNFNVYTNNYIDGYPASILERLGYIGLTIFVTMFLVGLFFGLKKWLNWLLRD